MSRRFSEEEAQRIFARVAERQRETAPADRGLSLAELEEAARAAGLDASLVVAAAAELDAAPHDERTILGAPVETIRTRHVAAPLDDDTWARLVGAARREFGQPGMAGQIGRLREWTLISGGTKNGTVTRLAAEPTAEGTRITVSRSIAESVKGFTLAATIQWGMALVFGTMALAGVDSELWIVTAVLFGLGLVFGAGSQIGTRVWHRQQTRRFDRLLDRLELAARDGATAPPVTAEPATAEPAPRLSLDADAPESPEAASAPRRTRA